MKERNGKKVEKTICYIRTNNFKYVTSDASGVFFRCSCRLRHKRSLDCSRNGRDSCGPIQKRSLCSISAHSRNCHFYAYVRQKTENNNLSIQPKLSGLYVLLSMFNPFPLLNDVDNANLSTGLVKVFSIHTNGCNGIEIAALAVQAKRDTPQEIATVELDREHTYGADDTRRPITESSRNDFMFYAISPKLNAKNRISYIHTFYKHSTVALVCIELVYRILKQTIVYRHQHKVGLPSQLMGFHLVHLVFKCHSSYKQTCTHTIKHTEWTRTERKAAWTSVYLDHGPFSCSSPILECFIATLESATISVCHMPCPTTLATLADRIPLYTVERTACIPNRADDNAEII